MKKYSAPPTLLITSTTTTKLTFVKGSLHTIFPEAAKPNQTDLKTQRKRSNETMTRRIIALNNMGVRSLQCGYLEEAILSFRHAIEIMKTQVVIPSPGIDSGSIDDMPLIRWSMIFFEEAQVRDVSPHNIFDIFPCAFGLPRFPSASDVPHEISVVLLYNLALAHHIAGLLGHEKNKDHLVQAYHHYKLCMAVFNSCTAESNFDLSFCSLLCGCCTNCGHILSHLGRTKEALSYGEYLSTLLESRPCTMYLSAEECEYFYTLTYSSKYACNAAPAA